MANRSLFPDGVETHSRELQYESAQRIADTKELLSQGTSRGVTDGLVVTVNGGDDTKIDISSGHGYTPSGEFITYAGSAAQLLSDYALNTVNYVILMHDELGSLPEAHESDGTTQNVRSECNARLVVLTAAQYAALPISDSVLSTNAQDRALIVAWVTAQGIGNPLVAANIQNAGTFGGVFSATQPTNISGVKIIAVSPSSNEGATGVLTFTAAGTFLKWAEPGDAAGADVAVAGGGTFTLKSASWATSGASITVYVTDAALPAGNQTDTIVLNDLYTQDVIGFTANDDLHRSLIGSGVASTKNPHGLTLSDLAPGAAGDLETHQDLQHSNGIWSGSSATALSCSVIGASKDQIQVTALAGGDTVYINGFLIQSSTGSPLTVALPVERSTFGVWMDTIGALSTVERARYTDPFDHVSDYTQIVNVSDNIGAGARPLQWDTNGFLQFDYGPKVESPAADSILRLYSLDHVSYVDVYVKAVAAPGGDVVNSITFYALPDVEANMLLAYVPWSGAVSNNLGYGFGAGNAPNGVYDRRLFGNVAALDMRSDFGAFSMTELVKETLMDGLVSRLETTDTGASFIAIDDFDMELSVLNATIRGGVVYLAGERLEIATYTPLALTNGATNYIFIDSTGVITKNTTGFPAGCIKLWVAVAAGGVELPKQRIDYRFYIGNSPVKGGLYVVAADSLSTAAGVKVYTNRSHFRSLKAAVDYISDIGFPRTIHLSPGTHVIQGTLVLPSGVKLLGDGSSTLRSRIETTDSSVAAQVLSFSSDCTAENVEFGKGEDSADIFAISVLGHNVALDHCRFYDVNDMKGIQLNATYDYLYVNNCYFELQGNPALTVPDSGGIPASNNYNITFNNCTIADTDDSLLACGAVGDNIFVDGFKVVNCRMFSFGTFVGNWNNVLIDGNEIATSESVAEGMGIQLGVTGGADTGYAALENVRITNNKYGSDQYPDYPFITLVSHTGVAGLNGTELKHSVISDNIVKCNGGANNNILEHQFGATGGANNYGELNHVTISNNLFFSNAGCTGIWFSGAMTDIFIENNDFVTTGSYGVRIDSANQGFLSIDNNKIYNNLVNGGGIFLRPSNSTGGGSKFDKFTISANKIYLVNGASTGDGIKLDVNGGGVQFESGSIIGNSIVQVNPGGSGIAVTQGSRLAITGNTIRNFATGLYLGATVDCSIAGNSLMGNTAPLSLVGTCSNNISNGSTTNLVFGNEASHNVVDNRYLSPGYGAGTPFTSHTAARVGCYGIVSNLYVYHDGTAEKNVTYTVYKNGVATGLTNTLTGGANSMSELVTSVTVAPGDRIAIVCHPDDVSGGADVADRIFASVQLLNISG